MNHARTIVIVGGGFAGTTLARALDGKLPAGYELLLVSEESYTTFNPMLPEALGASIFPEQVVAPIRQMVPHREGHGGRSPSVRGRRDPAALRARFRPRSSSTARGTCFSSFGFSTRAARSVSAVPHRAADLGAGHADVLEHAVAHGHQLARVAPHAEFLRDRAGGPPRDPAEPGRERPQPGCGVGGPVRRSLTIVHTTSSLCSTSTTSSGPVPCEITGPWPRFRWHTIEMS